MKDLNPPGKHTGNSSEPPSQSSGGGLLYGGDPNKPMSYQRAEQVKKDQKIKAKLRGGAKAGRGDVPHEASPYPTYDSDPTPPYGIPRPKL